MPSSPSPASPPAPDPSPAQPTPVPALYREMWHHARGARARLAAALAMLAGSQILKLALPWLTAQAINVIQTGGRAEFARALQWVAAILGLQVAVWLMHGPGRVLERGAALRVRASVADALYARLAAAPLAWHEQHHSGDLLHRVGQASRALFGFTQTQFIYLQNVILLVGPLVALALLSTATGVLAVAGFAGVALAVMRFDRALMRLAVRENQAERRYQARLLDFVGNIGAVASLRLQGATRRLLAARLASVFEPLARIIVITEWKWCVVDLATIGLAWTLVIVYALGEMKAAAATGGTLLVGSLWMVLQYAQQAGGVLVSMAAHFQGLAQTRADHAGAEPIRHAPVAPLRAQAPASPAVTSASAPRAEPAAPARGHWQRIELEGLSFEHARRGQPDGSAREGSLVDAARGGITGITLAMRRGERIALVGPSGSGKSTLLRVLAGLYAAGHGRVRVDGAVQPARDVAPFATLIPQEAEIFEASIRDNLAFGEPVPETAIARALLASAFDEVLAGLPHGLDTLLAERGTNLSGGQRQRLALARGVLAAHGSSVLLLDEPTSALDALVERHVHERLAAAFADACIVASVHRLSLLPHFDRVALMEGGRLVDVGTVGELEARQPLFAALVRGSAGRAAAPAAPAAPSGIALAA